KLKNGSGYSLLKDSVPCPIPTTEKDAHRAAPSKLTLPMRRRRSTRIVSAKGLSGRYRPGLLHK
ncbi:hypothetical protein, partial [Mesorhizobium sp. CU2]|uniref:hypothetical protein n=1 Tax=Mesorhizobium sp. CU2 TaxID=2589985 RepID=UPI001AEE355B